MNKSKAIKAAVAILLLLGAGFWLTRNQQNTPTPPVGQSGTSIPTGTPTSTPVLHVSSPDQFDIVFPEGAQVVDVSNRGRSMDGPQYQTYKDPEGRFEFRYDPQWGGVRDLTDKVPSTKERVIQVCSKNISYLLRFGTEKNIELEQSLLKSIGDFHYWKTSFLRGVLRPNSEFGSIVWTKKHYYSLGEYGGSCDTSEEPAPEDEDVLKAISESHDLQYSFINSLKIYW